MGSFASLVFLLLIGICCATEENDHMRRVYSKVNVPEGELQAEFWMARAQDTLKQHLALKPNTNTAKNIIMFLGDGMSIPTLTATRMLLGGENKQLSFEKFPYVGLSKTYCVDAQTADSACSATAYLCGVKTNTGTIGVTANVNRNSCEDMAQKENHVSSIADWAQKAGKAAGFVTTTRVTHASPAGTFAHTAERDWESDKHVIGDGGDPKVCPDIAEQLMNQEPGKHFKVVMGGGRANFRPKGSEDEEGHKNKRLDGRDLIDEWNKTRSAMGKAAYVWNKKQLDEIDASQTDYLLGLFESDHCKYHLDVVHDKEEDMEPSLAEMVSSAVDVLKKEKNGFFLFVEGGKIDKAHHGTKTQKALDETIEFAKAVEVALNKTSVEDTLIVVTSDHAHTMSISGYADRGNDIFGTALIAEDKLPMATLNYANGPGYETHIKKDGGRKDYTKVVNTADRNFVSPAIAPLEKETHGADDVAVFALGPWAHLFTGNYEQNTIPHLMAYAACIGDGAKSCDTGRLQPY